MGTCAVASSAVLVRRGSTTTTEPPRSMTARRRPGQSGAVAKLPFDAKGLAPRIRRWSVRSMSGTGLVSTFPKISPDEISFGRWSTVEAEKTFGDPSARRNARL